MAFKIKERSNTVYINCPPGDEYNSIRHGLMWAAMANGLNFECNFGSYLLGSHQIPQPHGLADGIIKSRYSFHVCDICNIENPMEFGRYHLPIELGMSLLERRRTDKNPLIARHEIFILIKNGHSYVDYLNTQQYGDCIPYDSDEEAIKKPFRWLKERQSRNIAREGPSLNAALEVFIQYI